MRNLCPFPHRLYLHPHETLQVFGRTSWAHFDPYTGVFDGTTLFDNETRRIFFQYLEHLFIQLYHPFFSPSPLSLDDTPLV
jgi:hypothetical protein